jgi:hypothetical protein
MSPILPLPLDESIQGKHEENEERGAKGQVFRQVEIPVGKGGSIRGHRLPFKFSNRIPNNNLSRFWVMSTVKD